MIIPCPICRGTGAIEQTEYPSFDERVASTVAGIQAGADVHELREQHGAAVIEAAREYIRATTPHPFHRHPNTAMNVRGPDINGGMICGECGLPERHHVHGGRG